MRNWVLRVSPFWVAELTTFSLSWSLYGRGEHGGVMYTFLKVVPILTLLAMSFNYFKSDSQLRKYHVVGVCCSLMGDILLANRSEQPMAMAAGTVFFGMSHLSYLQTFLNVQNLHKPTFVALIVLNMIFGAVSYEPMQAEPPFLRLILTGYVPILSFGVWSAVSEWVGNSADSEVGETAGGRKNRPIPKTADALRMFGYLSFLLSDSLILIDDYVMGLERSQFMIILTYYLAQLLIFMGTLTKEEEEDEKLKHS